MRVLLLAALLGAAASAAPAPELIWKYEGFQHLPAAAAEAKRLNKRILVGLAGSGT